MTENPNIIEDEPVELVQINTQYNPMAFRYIIGPENKKITVIATSSDDAKTGLRGRIPADWNIKYDGMSDYIMQI